MKKVILIFFLVATTGLALNADSLHTTSSPEEIAEEFGCASDCVQNAMDIVFLATEMNGDHPNDDPIYMELYNTCYYSTCVPGKR